MGLFQKLFGTYSERQIKRIRPLADAIEALAEKYHNMTDDELRAQTDLLRARLAEGWTEDDILVEAFATVREADERVLGKRPFYVQLLGGILLHQGRIAEMKTGEGKTLVATLPAYLNALSGKGVHIVTVNDYLARRDSEEMGKVYGFLGLTTGLVVHGQTSDEKHAAYNADITYGTNNEFGFDYLRDNMVIYRERMVQRGHHFAIVDEVDSILVDEARTPLIISGSGANSSELYTLADRFARTLKKLVVKETDNKENLDDVDADYIVDEVANTSIITASGIAKAEAFFHVENLADPENNTLYHHINQAIRAHGVMKRDVDYVVKDGKAIIVDAFTGRLMPGRRFNNGLHQAIEAKEKIGVQKESRTLATITFQNYFRMYEKISGMTGTALTEEDEFREIYALDVVEVPTNRPMIRIDENDRVYTSLRGKYKAIIAQIIECHKKGQPVLVGTVSIDKSEELSTLLKAAKIPHTVLNAKYHEREAEIIAQAGKEGAVTISTNMAGRGTDIMLGGNAEYMAKSEMRREGISEELIAAAVGTADTNDEEILSARARFRALYEKFKEEIAPEAERVRAAGGLYILGTERHESRRIDNQLRGRSGRQGDPGDSCFFLSLDDDLMRLFGNERMLGAIKRMGLPEDTPISAGILSGTIEMAQKRIEGNNFARRKSVLEYDDVMNQQRKIIYEQRRLVLDGDDLRETIQKMLRDSVHSTVLSFYAPEEGGSKNAEGLRAYYAGWLFADDDERFSCEALDVLNAKETEELLLSQMQTIYAEKEALFGSETFREVERVVLLRNVDSAWMEHLDVMDDIKDSVGLNGYAQRNPITEYRIQGAELFDGMVDTIRENTVKSILTVIPRADATKRVEVAKATGESGGSENAPQKRAPVKAEKKVGRNDPCPCGSGKKYKACCGANPNIVK
ncbi:MAG: preprotein translocase subunit SecA [Ruminococcaceae bacterium]|nr:preprotein translocase subunit SecA [Oscillospiraceae bacterium]